MRAPSDQSGEKRFEAIAASAAIDAGSRRDPMRIFLMILLASFIIIDRVAIAAATGSYRSLHQTQVDSQQGMLALGPVVSTVRANDAAGSIARGRGPEGESLVIIEKLESGTYETRIYLYQGNVVEEYAIAGTPYTPQKATVLGASSAFSFSYKDGLLSITTDSGTANVALRSVQGGE